MRSCLLASLSSLFLAAWANPVIFLDDRIGSQRITSQNAHAGTYAPCLADAYNGQFLHDWADNKGQAHAIYNFDPPKSGCYRIDEYHPGGADDMCSQYMPQATRLDVAYCLGKSAVLAVDQSVRGGQWNAVAHYPFFVGHPGALKLSNAQDEKCQADNCFWVADAFRLVWVADSCSAGLYGPVTAGLELEEVEAMEKKMVGAGGEAMSSAEAKKGVLALRVRGAEGGEGVDVQAQLLKHRGALEVALAVHLDYATVQVVDIVSEGRRLAGAAGTFRVHYLASGPQTVRAGGDGQLMQELQQSLDEAEAGLLVDSASVAWEAPAPQMSAKQQVDGNEGTSYYVIFVVAFVAIAMAFLVFGAVTYFRRRKHGKASTERTVATKEKEGVVDVANTVDAEKGQTKDDINDNASDSTAPPASEEEVHSEAQSDQGMPPTHVVAV